MNLYPDIPEAKRPAAIAKLPIRPQLKELLLGEWDAGPFASYFRMPSYFYAQGHPDKPADWPTFADRELYPLWEHYQLIFVVDVSREPHEYLSFYCEAPDEYQILSSIDKGIFEMIYCHVWEYGGGPNEADEALSFARQVGLPGLELLASLLANHSTCLDESIDAFRRSL